MNEGKKDNLKRQLNKTNLNKREERIKDNAQKNIKTKRQ